MSFNQDFLDRLRSDAIDARRSGRPYTVVYIHPQRAKLIEAELAVEHRGGQMWIEGVRVATDPGVPFEEYRLK